MAMIQGLLSLMVCAAVVTSAFAYSLRHFTSSLKPCKGRSATNSPLFAESNNNLFTFGRLSSNSKLNDLKVKKDIIANLVAKCQPNGLSASVSMKRDVDEACKALEKMNPTVSFSPYSKYIKMKGVIHWN